MTPQSTQTEDDLIIIGDVSSDTSMLDFNFDIKTHPEPVVNDTLISFAEEPKVSGISFDVSTEVPSQTEVKTNDVSEKIDFGFDLFGDQSISQNKEKIVETVVVIEEEKNINQDEIFDFGDSKNNTAEYISDTQVSIGEEKEDITGLSQRVDELHGGPQIDTVENKTQENMFVDNHSQTDNQIQDIFSRTDILQEAILKMGERKKVISQIKEEKQNQVDDLTVQIEKLKNEVTLLNNDIQDLDKEGISIEGDITVIEKMKSGIPELSERTRKHNLDNIKKK